MEDVIEIPIKLLVILGYGYLCMMLGMWIGKARYENKKTLS